MCVFQTNSLQTKAYHSLDRCHITVYDQMSKNFLFGLKESPECIVYNVKFKKVSLVSPAKGHCSFVTCLLYALLTALYASCSSRQRCCEATWLMLPVYRSPHTPGSPYCRTHPESLAAGSTRTSEPLQRNKQLIAICSTVTQLTSDFVAPGFYEKCPQANKRFLMERDRNKNWNEHAQQ